VGRLTSGGLFDIPQFQAAPYWRFVNFRTGGGSLDLFELRVYDIGGNEIVPTSMSTNATGGVVMNNLLDGDTFDVATPYDTRFTVPKAEVEHPDFYLQMDFAAPVYVAYFRYGPYSGVPIVESNRWIESVGVRYSLDGTSYVQQASLSGLSYVGKGLVTEMIWVGVGPRPASNCTPYRYWRCVDWVNPPIPEHAGGAANIIHITKLRLLDQFEQVAATVTSSHAPQSGTGPLSVLSDNILDSGSCLWFTDSLPGFWIQFDLGEGQARGINGARLGFLSANDYPEGFSLIASNDGVTWTPAVAGSVAIPPVSFNNNRMGALVRFNCAAP